MPRSRPHPVYGSELGRARDRGRMCRRPVCNAPSAAHVGLLEPRLLFSTTTTTLPVINPDFGTFFKPGSAGVTAALPAAAASFTTGIGPDVSVSSAASGSPITVGYSDGTSGTRVDVPGWTATAAGFSPPRQFVGAELRSGTSSAVIQGNYPAGDQITQTLDPSVRLRPNTTYTLSATIHTGNSTGTGATLPPLVVGLEAGGLMLAPAGPAVAPAPTGTGHAAAQSGKYTQTFTTGSTAPAGPVTIVLGVGPEAGGGTPLAQFSDVSLTATSSAPDAALSAPAVTAAGGATTTVQAVFSSPQGIDLSTVRPANLTVTGPNGISLAVTGVTVSPAGGTPTSVTATYTVAAPSGAGFTQDTNGTYTATFGAGQVADADGNAAAPATASFAVSVLGGALAAGSTDPTFAAASTVALAFSAQSAAVEANGQILVAGFRPVSGSAGGLTEGVLERLNADGTVDATFGGGSGVVTDAAAPGSPTGEAFYGVTPLSDGRILVAGTRGGSLLLARYNADGTLDGTFGAAGRAVTAVPGSSDAVAYGLAVDHSTTDGTTPSATSGDVVVVGSAKGQFVAERYTAAGAMDATFNAGRPLSFGPVATGAAAGAAGDVLSRVVVRGDGAAVAVGAAGGSVVVARLTVAGAQDPAFGIAGQVAVSGLTAPAVGSGNRPDHSEGLAIDPTTGDILVANTTASGDFATARLTAAGSLDAAFGTRGVVTTDFGSGNDEADFVAVQPDGQEILVGGTSVLAGATQEAIVAYRADGSLDPTFGNAGRQLEPAPAVSLAAGAGNAVLQVFGALRDGRLLLGADPTGGAASSVLRRLIAPSPASVGAPAPSPLPTGNLTATLTAKLPASAVGGQKINGSATVVVRNPSSATTFVGPVTVTLFVSPAESLTGATQLGTPVTQTLTLKPGKSRAIKVPIAVLPSVAKGTYHLVAAVKEGVNNTTTGVAGPAVPIAPAFTELTVSALQPLVATASRGAHVRVKLTLTNTGNQPINAGAALTLAASATADGAGPVNLTTIDVKLRLKVGKSQTLRVPFILPTNITPGRYFLTANLGVGALGDPNAADGLATSAGTILVQ